MKPMQLPITAHSCGRTHPCITKKCFANSGCLEWLMPKCRFLENYNDAYQSHFHIDSINSIEELCKKFGKFLHVMYNNSKPNCCELLETVTVSRLCFFGSIFAKNRVHRMITKWNERQEQRGGQLIPWGTHRNLRISDYKVTSYINRESDRFLLITTRGDLYYLRLAGFFDHLLHTHDNFKQFIQFPDWPIERNY